MRIPIMVSREVEKPQKERLFERLKKQGYQIVGSHSAVKTCKYTHDRMNGLGGCYKNKFYGIESHRCIQATPVLQFCNHSCTFCWRLVPETKTGWLELPKGFEWNTPEEIVEGMINAQLNLMSGYGGNKNTGKRIYNESLVPRHVALSLIGEPTMYPRLPELIKEFHKRRITTFLVSNGSLPEMLERLSYEDALPTQLYLSMVAPDRERFMSIARPDNPMGWERYMESLRLMGSGKIRDRTRTVLRMTLVRSLNVENSIKGYAEQIKIGKPNFVEVKSYSYVGYSRNKERGLGLGDVMHMEEIREFARLLAEESGYIVTDEHVPSRIVLLCRDEETERMRFLPHNEPVASLRAKHMMHK